MSGQKGRLAFEVFEITGATPTLAVGHGAK
jgi:hypothetical protein